MKKLKSIIGVILLLSIFSCGAIKKSKESKEQDTELNLNSNFGSNTQRFTNSKDHILEPIDLSKPIIFRNGNRIDTVWNTRVINNEKYIKEIIRDTTSNKLDLKEKKTEDTKNKETDNTILIASIVLGSLFLILIFMFLVIIYFVKQAKPVS